MAGGAHGNVAGLPSLFQLWEWPGMPGICHELPHLELPLSSFKFLLPFWIPNRSFWIFFGSLEVRHGITSNHLHLRRPWPVMALCRRSHRGGASQTDSTWETWKIKSRLYGRNLLDYGLPKNYKQNVIYGTKFLYYLTVPPILFDSSCFWSLTSAAQPDLVEETRLLESCAAICHRYCRWHGQWEDYGSGAKNQRHVGWVGHDSASKMGKSWKNQE